MKKEEIPFILIGAIFVTVLAYMLIIELKKQKSLELNWEYCDAVILNFVPGMRGRYSLEYIYFINETKYQGRGTHYPKSDTLSIGDTIVIVYDKTNPAYSKHERDFYRKITIKDSLEKKAQQ